MQLIYGIVNLQITSSADNIADFCMGMCEKFFRLISVETGILDKIDELGGIRKLIRVQIITYNHRKII